MNILIIGGTRFLGRHLVNPRWNAGTGSRSSTAARPTRASSRRSKPSWATAKPI